MWARFFRTLPFHLVRSLLRRNHAQPICLSHSRMPRNPKPIIVAAFSFSLSIFSMTPIYPYIANYCSFQPFGRFGLRAWGFVFCAPLPTSPCSRAESVLHAGALAAPRRSLGSKAQKTGLRTYHLSLGYDACQSHGLFLWSPLRPVMCIQRNCTIPYSDSEA